MSTANTTNPSSRPLSRAPETVICAMTEGRTQATVVGLCFLHAATNECTLCNIADSQTYIRTLHKLDVHDPMEIYIPQSMVQPKKSKLVLLVEECFPETRLVPCARKLFDEYTGIRLVETLSPAGSADDDVDQIKFELGDKYFTACAAACCLTMARERTAGLLRAVRFNFESSEASMVIDSRTLRSLELVGNKYERQGMSLFKMLNRTQTPMGYRVLKSNILQPLTSIDTLNLRLDAVHELSTKEDMTNEVIKALKKFQDFDRLLTSILVPNEGKSWQKINLILLLKQAVTAAMHLQEVLSDAECLLITEIRDVLGSPALNTVLQLIASVVNEDCQWAKTPLELQNQQAYCIKSGTNGFLDASREVYKQITDKALALIEQLGETHGIALESKYDPKRGFTMRASCAKVTMQQLPAEFINRKRVNQHIEFTTVDLAKCSARRKSALSEILLLSDQVVTGLAENIAEFASSLFQVSEAAAVLDMLQSFAKLNTQRQGYVRPKLVNGGGVLAIRSGRHPVLESILPSAGFVSNDVYMARDTSRVCIVTGANMSGKSVYLRQVALLTVMAQVGSYVPADYAQFPVVQSLHARICHDIVSCGAGMSSFSREMTEMAHFIKLCSERPSSSLLLIDELGRGSSVVDGLAISMAITEYLADCHVHTLLATHFTELASLLGGNKPGCSTVTMKTDVGDHAMKMYYKVVTPGPELSSSTAAQHYGVKFASGLPFPQQFITKAHAIARALDEIRLANQASMHRQRQLAVTKLVLELKDVLTNLASDRGGLDADTRKRLLSRLQHRFVNDLERLQ